MHFAMSHDAVPPERLAETYEPSAANQRRMSTTATLLALAVCVILAKGHLLEARTPAHNAAVAQSAGTAPVTIVAPEFCKDQTWPYIDSRCLRRVDNPPPPADTHQAIAPPATTVAATPAPDRGSGNTVAATPPTAATTAAQTNVETNAPPAAAATDTRRPGHAICVSSRPHRTPEPTPPPTPTRAPTMLHNAVGRSIGITIPASFGFRF